MSAHPSVVSIPRRGGARGPLKRPSRPRKPKLLTARKRRSLQQLLAAVGAAILPVTSYVLVHFECEARPWLWAFVVAALAFSAPSMAAWARTWTANVYKAWGFTLLFEGSMVASHILPLSLASLAVLVAINCASAWECAAEPKEKKA